MSKALRVALVVNGTVLHEQIAAPGSAITVGHGPNAAFALPGTDADEHPLFDVHERDCTLTLRASIDARLVLNGEPRVVSGHEQLALGLTDWGILNAGPASVFFQWIDDTPAPSSAGWWERLDVAALSALLASVFAHLALAVVAMSAVPTLAAELTLAHVTPYARVVVGLPPDPTPDPARAHARSEPSAAAAERDEGRLGAADSPLEHAVLPAHDAPRTDPLQTPELGTAMRAAIGTSGALTSVFGASDVFASNFGADFATAGQGDAFVLGQGSGGLGLRGLQRGGGGDALGHAHGIGLHDGDQGVRQGAALGHRAEVRRATVTLGSVRADGGFLSREAIDRVVRVHQRGLRYCYERELQADPMLEGRVTAAWTIGLDGRVASARITENTTQDRDVEACMLHELGRMRFPQPDGGLVVVSYPFTFRAAQ